MMKKTAALILLLLAAVALSALGTPETSGKTSPTVRVSGRVRLVGSSPNTMLVISGEEREWYIETKEQKKLMRLQQQTVTVEGKEYFVDQTFANGVSAGRRYYLKNIKIINNPGADS
ncbi:MAG: hypothetical protein LBD48_06755 [Treponema sp.]|jgi:hypothetical protein|nr:hypothetical protein [Treponema sp.]